MLRHYAGYKILHEASFVPKFLYKPFGNSKFFCASILFSFSASEIHWVLTSQVNNLKARFGGEIIANLRDVNMH